MDQSPYTQAIAIQCLCGKRLTALPQHAGKRVKCPSCGQVVVVPVNLPSQPTPMVVENTGSSEGLSRNTFIALWSLVGVLALGGILFIFLHTRSTHQTRVAAANMRVSQAVVAANAWVARGSSQDGDAIERALVDAQSDNLATEKANIDSIVATVRQRREALATEARTDQAQRDAAAVFSNAKRQIDGKRIAEAIVDLRKYIAGPYATEKADAQRLLAESEIAISDELAVETLLAMNDVTFEQAKAVGEIKDGKVSHPVLHAVRSETLQRNIVAVHQRRENAKVAEAQRRAAAEAAIAERNRRAEEMRMASLEAMAAEEKRLREQREAKLAALRNPPSVSLKDLSNFPEDYSGKPVKLESIWFWGDLDRQVDHKLFSVTVESRDGKVISHYFIGKDLKFVVSEGFGRILDVAFDADKKVGTNIYCEIGKVGETPVARIYRIETLNRAGEVKDVHEDKFRDGADGPRPAVGKTDRARPASVVLKDLANFPEDYAGAFVKLESIWIWGELKRQAEHKLFSITVESRDGKVVSNFFIRDEDLAFVVSEGFGRVIDILFEADKKFGSNIYCEITSVGKKRIAKIYRIETLNLAGDVKDVYEDR